MPFGEPDGRPILKAEASGEHRIWYVDWALVGIWIGTRHNSGDRAGFSGTRLFHGPRRDFFDRTRQLSHLADLVLLYPATYDRNARFFCICGGCHCAPVGGGGDDEFRNWRMAFGDRRCSHIIVDVERITLLADLKCLRY